MKKKITILLMLTMMLTLGSIKTDAQITLDTVINPWNGFGWDFYTVQISPTETKYLFSDTTTNTFSLYNMNFTPFMLNIPVPEPFLPYGFQVLYVTRSLFDCDSTNIEFVYALTTQSKKPYYIMRTDGIQLFKMDSAMGIYCAGGCLGYSDIIKPIKNTSDGAKMFLHRGILNQKVYIYSLCGELPEDIPELTAINQSFIKLYPNPSSNLLNFEINLPDNINDFDLVIYNSTGAEIRREKVSPVINKFTLDLSCYSNGVYCYYLCTKNKMYQSGKFIINK